MRIAVTGGIAEGKSTILSYIADLGIQVESADAIAREVMQSPHVQLAIASILNSQPPFDRDLLRMKLAESPDFRKKLNSITHPIIQERISKSEAQFFEIPLLFEACMQSQFDAVWVVTCGVDEQRRRLLKRYADLAQVEHLLRIQLPSRAKTPFSDVVIRTNEAEDRVRQLVTLSVSVVFNPTVARFG
ncbi:dephospho-CoA kinase [soil metagenome]